MLTLSVSRRAMQFTDRFSRAIPLRASVLGLAILALTGCSGLSPRDATVASSNATIRGILHGGPSPIIGATVTLYATQNNGYGGTAIQLGNTTTTNSTGAFTFVNATPYTCPAGQFAYLTAAGGNSGGNTNNNQILFVAAIGPCSTLTTSTQTWIDELTTVAAAYALGNFTTVSGSGAAAVVNISAPAGNNASTPCVANSGTCTVTQTSGLAHAFATALNLVNTTTGQAYATLPTQTVANSGVPAVTPSVEINTLGNILQTCVNSGGGTAGDSSGCGSLLKDTTPPGGTAPTNTLQAMMDLAKYPSLGTSQTLATYNSTSAPNAAVAAIYNLAAAQSFYLPTLSAAPPDWALSIVYPPGNGGTTAANNLTFPYLLALDIADNVYVLNTNATVAEQNFLAYQNNGIPLWQTAVDSTRFTTPRGFALDSIGNMWMTQYSGTYAGVAEYSQANGAFIQNFTLAGGNPVGVIVDPSNNVFVGYGQAAVSGQGIFELVYANGYKQAIYTVTPQISTGIYQFGFDKNMNLWASGFNNANLTTTTIYTLPNTGTVSAPVFFKTAVVPTSIGGYYDYGVVLDATGTNAYTTNSSGIYEIAATGSGTSLTTSASSATPLFAAAPPREMLTDGGGTIWISTYATSTSVGLPLEEWSTTSESIVASINSCYVPSGTKCITTASGSTYPPIYAGRGVAADSAGNLWYPNAIGGTVTEIIGLASPTWPQLSTSQFGKPATLPAPSTPAVSMSTSFATSGSTTPIPPSFVGLTLQTSGLNDRYVCPSLNNGSNIATRENITNKLLNALNSAGGGPSLRMIGERVSYSAAPDTSAIECQVPAGPSLTESYSPLGPTGLGVLANIVKNTGAPILFGLDLQTGEPGPLDTTANPSNDALFAQAANAALPAGSSLLFEIGNEPDLYEVTGIATNPVCPTNTFRVCGYSSNPNATLSGANNFVQDFSGVAQAVSNQLGLSSAQTKVFEGPSADLNFLMPGALSTILQTEASNIALASVHRYGTGPTAENAYASTALVAHDFLVDTSPTQYASGDSGQRQQAYNLYLLSQAVPVAQSAGVPIRLTEMSVLSGGGIGGPTTASPQTGAQVYATQTMAAALWTVDWLFDIAHLGMTGVNATSFFNAAYSTFDFIHPSADTVSVYPIFYGLQFVAEAFRGQPSLVPLTTDPSVTCPSAAQADACFNTTEPYKIWAIQDALNHQMRFAVINKTASTSAIQLNIPITYGIGSVIFLQPPALPPASALLSTNGITLGGQTYDGTTDGSMLGSPVATALAPNATSYIVTVPAYSAALVTFQL